MFLFGKNKKSDNTAAGAKPAASGTSQAAVSADDFFNDLDNKKKNKAPASIDIDLPEITGLREKPADAPEKNFVDIDTDTMSMSGLRTPEEAAAVVDMKDFSEISASEASLDALEDKSAIDFYFDPDAPDESETAAPVFDPSDPDAFFKNMGRKPKKQRFGIDLPDVSSLREAPEEVPPDTLTELDTSALSLDGLRPEMPCDDE
ncbi:MAG: hypothetical protein ACI4KF_08135 [Huintestinicola sp.]